MNLGIRESTVDNNRCAARGGALLVFAALDSGWIENSTLSGNTTEGQPGSALASGSTHIRIADSTIAFNPGVALYAEGSLVEIRGSIVAGDGRDHDNCQAVGGTISSGGYNVDSGTGCGFDAVGDRSGTDPRLHALADNGGPTPTHAPIAHGEDVLGSPAIDAAGTGGCPTTDQRGYPRPAGADCDIGAVESELNPGPGDTITVRLESPAGDVTGVGATRGWALSDHGIRSLALFVDGLYAGEIPGNALRPDVADAFPGTIDPAHSGFSRADNYSEQAPGSHTMVVRATDREGLTREAVQRIEVSRFGETSFLPRSTPVDLSGVVPTIEGGDVLLRGVRVEGVRFDLVLRWITASQDFDIVRISPAQ